MTKQYYFVSFFREVFFNVLIHKHLLDKKAFYYLGFV